MEARMLRMDEFNKIRKEFYINGKSIYQISREYNRSWATVKNIVVMPEHKFVQRGKRPGKLSTVITPEVENRIIEFLDFEIANKVPKKQRFTATFIFKKLKEEEIYKGSSKRIRTIVSKLRRERKQTKKTSFLLLDFEFGEYLQIDHGPVEVEIDGLRINGYLFAASVPGACLRYCQFYPKKEQESWGHFHETAFNFFGGKFSKIIYDNDSVLKINKTNEETAFAIELQIHYDFKAIYCNKAAGWEKGAVENAVGYCRRNFLAGIKSSETIESLNNILEEECLKNIAEKKHYISDIPLSDLYNELKSKIKPYKQGRSWGRWETLHVDDFQVIKYQYKKYSVPEKYVGSNLRVFITATNINIYDGHDLIYSHERLFLNKNDTLILDHYLEQLLKKPRAIKYAKVIKNYKFEQHLTTLREKLDHLYDENDAGKHFVKILLLKRTSSIDEFNTAIELALDYNAISSQGVQSILNQLQTVQTRTILDVDYPLIDHHFSLNKYAQLEQTGGNYD